MKNIFTLLIVSILLVSCSEDNDDNVQSTAKATFNFSHNWDGTAVTSADFNTIQYTNANGEMLSIERLRYLISDVTFTNTDELSIRIDEYNLVNLGTDSNLTYAPNNDIPTGTYTVSFTFGFQNEKNIDGAYLDLNGESWNVPAMLGGGYHYMQFDGKFMDAANAEVGFNYHAIRAVDNPGNPTFPQDTYFTVNLGTVTITKDVTFNVEMNIAEWFKNPNTWDLNTLNTVLMPNSMAQIMMHANGQTAFSLGSVNQ